jgi:hypothetical protein
LTERVAKALDRFQERMLEALDTRTRPTTPPKGTPGTQERRRGQALTKEEKTTYIRILETAKGLKLPHRYPNKNVEIAEAAGCHVSTVIKARKWGLRHGRG